MLDLAAPSRPRATDLLAAGIPGLLKQRAVLPQIGVNRLIKTFDDTEVRQSKFLIILSKNDRLT